MDGSIIFNNLEEKGYSNRVSFLLGILIFIFIAFIFAYKRLSQRTDLEEFYPTVDLQHPELKKKLQEWQHYYKEFRPHGSLNGKTPWEKWGNLFIQAPNHDEVEAAFDESKERLRLQSSKVDLYWQNWNDLYDAHIIIFRWWQFLAQFVIAQADSVVKRCRSVKLTGTN